MMLPSSFTEYFPVVGILMLLVAVILEIVSAVQYKELDTRSAGQTVSDTVSFAKYHNMALLFAVVGLALIMFPQH